MSHNFMAQEFGQKSTDMVWYGPITSWQTDGERVETVTDFLNNNSDLFSWAKKITVDSDCNCEIKRRLLLGRKSESESRSVESDSANSPGQNTAVGSRSLLQGIFPTHDSNPGLPHCRQILY